MACALGGPVPLFGASHLPVTVLVRGGAQVVRYGLFQAGPHAHRKPDFAATSLQAQPLYGGGIHVFRTNNHTADQTYFVRAHLADGRARDSDLISAPIASQPTRYAAGGLQFDAAASAFEWTRIVAQRWVSFVIVRAQVADSAGLLAAVYVFGDAWSYPNLASAPFHYRGLCSDTASPPDRLPETAEALYFAVRRDGWVTAFDRLAPASYSPASSSDAPSADASSSAGGAFGSMSSGTTGSSRSG